MAIDSIENEHGAKKKKECSTGLNKADDVNDEIYTGPPMTEPEPDPVPNRGGRFHAKPPEPGEPVTTDDEDMTLDLDGAGRTSRQYKNSEMAKMLLERFENWKPKSTNLKSKKM